MSTTHANSAVRIVRSSYLFDQYRRFLILICGSGAFFLDVGPFDAAGDSGAGASGQGSTQTPKINFQVLSQQAVNVGGRWIIYNLVAPPVLPAPTPSPTPIPLTPEQQQALAQREQKKYDFMFLGANVYDHQVSDVTLYRNGHQYHLFSNIDFNNFGDVGEIETSDVIYELFILPTNEQRTEWDTAVPKPEAFSRTKAQYVVVPDAANLPSPDVLVALDALHAYYDANRQRLIEDTEKRELAYAAQQKWEKEHPPVPHDTVINYWPEKNSAYLKASNGTHQP